MREIDLRREQRGALDPPIVLGGHVAERRRQQGSADAIADGGDLVLVRGFFDRLESGEDALLHIGVEALRGVARVRVDPGDDENRQPLRDRPADEGFFRIEIEDVEFVDPGGHDQQGTPQDLVGRGRILDELDEIVAEHDLAGRRREVDADLERPWIGLAQLQLSAACFHVLGEHLRTAHQIGPVLLEGFANELRIQRHEIRRRKGGGELAHVELRLVARVGIDILGFQHHVLGPFCRVDIGLAQEIEEGILRPGRIPEPPIGRIGRLCRRHLLALEAAQGIGPKSDQPARQPRLRLDRALRLAQPPFGDLAERSGNLGDLGAGQGRAVAAKARRDIRMGSARRLIGQTAEIGGKRLKIEVGGRSFGLLLRPGCGGLPFRFSGVHVLRGAGLRCCPFTLRGGANRPRAERRIDAHVEAAHVEAAHAEAALVEAALVETWGKPTLGRPIWGKPAPAPPLRGARPLRRGGTRCGWGFLRADRCSRHVLRHHRPHLRCCLAARGSRPDGVEPFRPAGPAVFRLARHDALGIQVGRAGRRGPLWVTLTPHAR